MARSRFNYRRHYLAEHDNNPKRFSGKLSFGSVQAIAGLVKELHHDRPEACLRLLDWGSGKGYQYLRDRAHEEWGGILPYCYDIGVRQLQEKPFGKFDGIICTDVLEHIDRRDLDNFLDEIFGYLQPDRLTFVYFNISTRPAGKTFDDGRNMHLTVQPAAWWNGFLENYMQANLLMKIDYEDTAGYDL